MRAPICEHQFLPNNASHDVRRHTRVSADVGCRMKLSEAIGRVGVASDELCIVAKRPWDPDSEAELIQLTEDSRVPVDVKGNGYEYFLEVDIIRRELMDAFPKTLTSDQVVSAAIYYAEFDATPQWLNELLQHAAGT